MYLINYFSSLQVNHFPGTFQIGRKDRLWRNLSKMQSRFKKVPIDEMYMSQKSMYGIYTNRITTSFQRPISFQLMQPCYGGIGMKVLTRSGF